ncbi:ATP binding protein, putative [Ricinus communis]|uniref:non-specific serine/threonine protein kinase n=1 Tax=Ricinus communis TaxID=3988 RepID=B9RIT2_RICCO|nr:ATP binding protein, putative [Ricinus communis]
MSYQHQSSLNKNLSTHTSFFGIRLWIILVAFVLLFTALILIVIFISIVYLCRQKKSKSFKPHFLLPNAISCSNNFRNSYSASSLDRRLLSQRIVEIEMNMAKLDHHTNLSGTITTQDNNNGADLESVARYFPVVFDAWRGNRFTYHDIEVMTDGFSDENLIGNGDRGVVYRGILLDATRVAVKSLLSKSCQAEEFVDEVEVIGHVRHKNIVKLLGCCTEGGYRILVNEYVDNGNLHQWLHGWTEEVSPLTWGIRMNIIQGVAKGLAYLHEDIEPKIIHQTLKSTNILLDHQWNPKISDFGIVKLCGPGGNQMAARLMGTSGAMCLSSAKWNLVYLIDWLKSMVASHKIMYIADPKLPEFPSSKELKRVLLLALRCVDPDIKHRPTMRDVIHMLQPRDLLLNDERRFRRDSPSHQSPSKESQIIAKAGESDFTTHERERSSNAYQKMILE